MNMMLFFRVLIYISMGIGLCIPMVGMFFLLRNSEQNKTTVSLMMTNMASIVMNVSYSYMLLAESQQEASMAMRIEYIGNALFAIFFIMFLMYYLRLNYLKVVFPVWICGEVIIAITTMVASLQSLTRAREMFDYAEKAGQNIYHIESGPVEIARNAILAIVLFSTFCITVYRFNQSPIKKEKKILGRVAIAEGIIILAAILNLCFDWKYDITPIAMSIGVFVLDRGLINGELLRVTDMGREWMFDNISEALIIVDSVYKYLDSNREADTIFPELRTLPKERLLPDSTRRALFASGEDVIEIGGRRYRREVLKMRQDDVVMGYAILLKDLTEQMMLMDRLREEKERADEANQAKSNFVSTISHEIRTPMNAIVGIADILLRKRRDKEDTDYLMNIKSSGDALLLIINDILDFSKIEAGKMKIVEEEYQPAVMLNDMHMIFVTRIGSKPVELKYDIMENLPGKLYGDALRIRQIIINFMNNAIKFTESGSVELSVREFVVEDESAGNSIEDKAIGNTVESNNISGVKEACTGMEGNDISVVKKTSTSMDGNDISSVEEACTGVIYTDISSIEKDGIVAEDNDISSFEEVGADVADNDITSADEDGTDVADNDITRFDEVGADVADNDITSFEEVGADVADNDITSFDGVGIDEADNDIIWLEFAVSDTGQGIKEEDISKLFGSFSQVDEKKNHSKEGTGLGLAICKQLAELMGGYVGVESTYGKGSKFYVRIPQRIIEREPIKVIEREYKEDFAFCCPNTKLLLVDDNEMNLKVAKGLLEPLKMDIDTAMNGKEAVAMAKTRKYDIVFMDHMMPVMDGVEATGILRGIEDDYFKALPIIALSANVTEEARTEFEACGMNEFLSKPIKMNMVCEVLKNMLPKEQIVTDFGDDEGAKTIATDSSDEEGAKTIATDSDVGEGIKTKGDIVKFTDDKADGSKNDIPQIPELDVAAGIENCGTKDLYVSLLGDFYKYIDIKANKIEKCLADSMIRDYTIEVHALKNTSRMIGALELSEEFKNLEALGNKEDEMTLIELTPITLEKLRALKPVLKPYATEGNEEKQEVDNEAIIGTLRDIYNAMDSFDLDGADEALKRLMGYRLPENMVERANELEALVADVAIEESMSLARELEEML